MKKYIISGLVFFCMVAVANAELVVIYNQKNKEIYSISEKDDTVTPKGHDKVILPGMFEDYEFTDNPTNYKYKSGKFIKNLARIEMLERRDEERRLKREQEERINQKLREMALKELGEE